MTVNQIILSRENDNFRIDHSSEYNRIDSKSPKRHLQCSPYRSLKMTLKNESQPALLQPWAAFDSQKKVNWHTVTHVKCTSIIRMLFSYTWLIRISFPFKQKFSLFFKVLISTVNFTLASFVVALKILAFTFIFLWINFCESLGMCVC